MELADILGAGASAVSGGLFGLIGFGVKALFGWMAEREKRQLLAQQNEHEINLIREQRASREVETENERAIAAEETRRESYNFANVSQPVYTWVASFISMMRPAITLYLLVVASVIVGQQLFGTSPAAVKAEAINTVLFLTCTAVTWWFGDRPPQSRK